jgi:hypothetical protein
MEFNEMDLSDFSNKLQMLKAELDAEMSEGMDEFTDEIHLLMESIDVLGVELDGVKQYDDMDLAKKRKVLPHLALAFLLVNTFFEDDMLGLFDAEGDEDYDEEDDEEGEEEEEEEEEDDDEDDEDEISKRKAQILQMKPGQCCNKHHPCK